MGPEVETTNNKATNKNRVSALSLGATKQSLIMFSTSASRESFQVTEKSSKKKKNQFK